MKNLKKIILFLSVTFIFFAACKKDNSSTTTVVPLTRLQLLTNKVWQIDEVERSINGINSSFIKGGVNSTGTAYNNIKIKFNLDFTGTYTDENSVQTTLKWEFSTPDERNALITIGSSNPVTYKWNMIELKDNYLHCVTPYNSNSLYAVRYIQIP